MNLKNAILRKLIFQDDNFRFKEVYFEKSGKIKHKN